MLVNEMGSSNVITNIVSCKLTETYRPFIQGIDDGHSTVDSN
jgi:hypothetical protein